MGHACHLGVDLTNLCWDVCVKDSETDPFSRDVKTLKTYPYGWDNMAKIPHIEGLYPDKC